MEAPHSLGDYTLGFELKWTSVVVTHEQVQTSTASPALDYRHDILKERTSD